MGRLYNKLTSYSESDFYPYHMPGHKRNAAGDLPKTWTENDITEIDGFDNLHQAEGILKELQEDAAKAYGAKESFYLVNGSTCGILSAISGTVPFGGELLIARNCHKSVYHAAYLRQLKLSYIYPQLLEEFDVCEAVTVKQVEEALEEHPNVSAVLIVSPTYEGRIADVETIAKVVHAHGLPLIVDEAHGAHLGFSKEFALNSCRLGADIVINSVHKTLPAMTQTALLHVNSERIDLDKIKRFLHIYQTSSPSYVLMASIEEAVQIATQKKDAFEVFVKYWKELLQTISVCQKLRFLPVNARECEKKRQDFGKIVISVKGTGLSGQQLYDILLERYHLQMEMVCESYVLAMFTIGDTKEAYERLGKALLEIDGELVGQGIGNQGATEDRQKSSHDTITVNKSSMYLEAALSFHEAWDMEKEYLSLQEAAGRLAGEFINLYPPGTPIAVPGEKLTKEVVCMIECCLEEGLTVQGISSEGYVAVLKHR